jgi:mono/diheme cytochrome c family protein
MKIFKNVIKVILALIAVFLISGYIYFSSRYPEVGEAPDIKIERTPERIEKGKYLFNNVAACVDCHSERDFSKLSGPVIPGTEGKGGMALGEEFGLPGTFYAKNITPYALESWTDGEILRAITEGVSKDGSALFPIMPYMAFGKMDKEDMYSIIAYLRTLPAVKNDVPKSKPKFPMNFIMKTIPTKSSFTSKPDPSNSVEYGKYLLEAASCMDCHTPMNDGQYMFDKHLSGGTEIKLPGGMINRPANLTPDNETGLGLWTKEQFINTFKHRAGTESINTPVKQGEFQTVMPWWMYGRMTDDDLGAIYDYLRTIPAIKNQVTKFEMKLY